MGVIMDYVIDFASSRYHSMPRVIRRKLMEEGYRMLEREDPEYYSILPEEGRKHLVQRYYIRREMERCKDD